MQYTYLEKLLSHGAYVVVKNNESNQFRIITPFTDSDGEQRVSLAGFSIEECKRDLVRCSFGQQFLEKYCENSTLVEVFYQPFKPFEVGQRVKVIATGKENAVKTPYLGRYFLNGDNHAYHYTELIPLPDETPITLSTVPSEELLQEVKRRGLSTMGEIIKG